MTDWLQGLLAAIALYWALRIVVASVRIRRGRFAAVPNQHLEPPEEPATVSICVPARNEAQVIGTCVQALLQQDWPGVLELIVVDDASDDGTAACAEEAACGDPRLRVVRGEGPPPGWMGKSAALWRAQSEARGEWLAFVDADVVLHPHALSVAMGAAEEHGASMLSWLGQLVTGSFWEHVLMPFIGDLIALFSPLSRVNDAGRDDCLANGQFILISREAYDAIGGHEAIRDSVVDDISMSRAVKHGSPHRYVLLQSLGLMRVRMYDSLEAIWSGFSKNFYAAAKRQAPLLVVLVTYILVSSVLPWLALGWFLLTGQPEAATWAALAVQLTLIYRLLTLRYSPTRPWALLLHPLAALLCSGIVIDSLLRGLGLRKPTTWKGRAVS